MRKWRRARHGRYDRPLAKGKYFPRLIPLIDGYAISGNPEVVKMSSSEKRHRNERVIFRLTSEERSDFEDRCQASGVSKSDYFRKQCLQNAPLRKRKSLNVDRQVLIACLGQLGKTGSNLNQIAKEYNMGYLPSNDELDIALVELRKTLLQIRKSLGYDY